MTPPPDTFTIAPALVQPSSRGSARLDNDNFQDAAIIDGNYLGTDQDFAAIVRAVESARELGNQHSFDSLRESELIPGPKASAEEVRELARLASASFGHAVGTCKMGVDTLAVVEPRASRSRRFGITSGRRLRDATDNYWTGDSSVYAHDGRPRRPVDSWLETRHRMTISL